MKQTTIQTSRTTCSNGSPVKEYSVCKNSPVPLEIRWSSPEIWGHSFKQNIVLTLPLKEGKNILDTMMNV